MARYVLVISADAQAPLSPKLLLFPGALLIFVAQPSLFPCLQKSCCVLERPWQSLRHSALCCSFTRRCGRGVPCLGSWMRGGSPMLWTSLGSPWGPHGLNPAACPTAGKAAGNICHWDREIFGPQGLSGQISSMVVSVTVSNQQQGRFVRDKVLQRKHWGLFKAKAEPSLRGYWLAPGFKWDLLDNPQSRSPGRKETVQSHCEVV